MIRNNFEAIQVVHEHRSQPLTPAFVIELQAIVTEGTLDEPAHAGHVQTAEEERVHVADNHGEILHRPPPAEQLPERMERMCDFANGLQPQGFTHPVVRAILLHLWLAYDHPFTDGNGRTARALFFWSLLNQGYWLAEYLSISRLLKKAPSRYARSFLYTETDDNDATYFLLSQLRVLCRSIDELHTYLQRKMEEVREVEVLLRDDDGLNHRQIALLTDASRNPGGRYTFASHARSHRVVYQSARTDLQDLARRGLLERRRVGKEFVFTAPADLAQRLSGARSDGAAGAQTTHQRQ